MAGYSIDLASISLDEFCQTLLTVELLPSRRRLADEIERVTENLGRVGIRDLAGLRKLLAAKASYPELGDRLGVDAEYLTLLNREVNSYVSKPIPLTKLGYLDDDGLTALAECGIKSTKDVYRRTAAKTDRARLAEESGVTDERLERLLGLSNLVRINGVGPAFAEYLLDAGLRGPADFIGRDLRQMVEDYSTQVPDGPRLRIEDLEFVQRYCTGLAEEIEW